MIGSVESGPANLPTVEDVLHDSMGRSQTIDLGDGVAAYVVNQPGRTLNLSAHRRIYQALVPVTTRSFAADMTPYWAHRSREGYLERLSEFVLVTNSEGRMVGWTGYHVLPFDEQTIVYLDSTGMVPEYQSRGVMRQLMRNRVAFGVPSKCPPDRPVYLSARSESPVFYRLMQRLLPPGELFPQPGSPVPQDLADCAAALAEWLGQRHILERETLALRGAYDTVEELYGELPTTGDRGLDELFRARLGPLDAYLLVGKLNDPPAPPVCAEVPAS